MNVVARRTERCIDMKRFINLSLSEKDIGANFAWWDTIKDQFETHSGSMAWSSFEEFLGDYKGNEQERYFALFPKNEIANGCSLHWKKVQTTFGDQVGLFAGSKKIAQVSFNSMCPKDVVDRKYVGVLLLPQANQARLYAEHAIDLKAELERLSKEWLIQAGFLED